MRHQRTPARAAAVLATAALVLAGCGGDDTEQADSETEATSAPATDEATSEPTESEMSEMSEMSEGSETGTSSETAAAGGDVATGRGITEEPCPDGNPDRGCIYLGIISDLSVGPFAPLGVPITDAQVAFWDNVNENGGIGEAYDVNVEEYTRDAEYNPQIHAEEYETIRGDVLALAQSLGTSQSLSVIDAMREDNMVTVPMTWWSGWNFDPLILQTGSSYCAAAMNGVDYVADDIETLSIVKFPGDYGEDWAAGVRLAAEAQGIEVLGEDVTQVPISAGGDVAATVGAVAGESPDAVFLATGPTELGQIVGGLAQQGYEGRYIGSNPTYNGALLESAVADILTSSYIVVSPFEGYQGTTPTHQELQAAIPDPANDGATFGWVMSLPLKGVLDAAYESGDLTPEGVAAAATSATVSYGEVLPDLDLSGDPDSQSARVSTIGTPNAEEPTGLSTTEIAFGGDSAANYTFEEPCFNVS